MKILRLIMHYLQDLPAELLPLLEQITDLATDLRWTWSHTAEQDALYSRAEGLAKQAVETDGKNPEGYFERARALGRLSQRPGDRRSGVDRPPAAVRRGL